MDVKAREIVIFADDFEKLSNWYREVFNMDVHLKSTDGYHYCHLKNAHGLEIGIADGAEMGVTPGDRGNNSVVFQIEVEDVKAFFAHIESHQGKTPFGPAYDENDGFWFGSITDIEGNPIWVVDVNCP